MVTKKIKKSMTTLTGIFISILLVVGFFTGMFLYMNKVANEHSMTLDSKYSETYTRLNSATSGMDDNVQEIKNSFAGMTEGGIGKFVTNGIEGLGSTLKLVAKFISVPTEIITALILPVDFVPTWVKTLITIGIIGIGVFLVLSILKGDQQKL